MARRPAALQRPVVDRWCPYVPGGINHIAEANGFVNFELSFDASLGRRVIAPRNYVVVFAGQGGGARQKGHSSLLTLQLRPEEDLPEQVQVGVEVRGLDGESAICSGEYVEFELLSSVNDASKQPPLRIAAGPVRVNAENQQREFMRINLGRCVRQIVTDIIDDPKHKGQKLVRSRWWVCVEVLRLVCSANSLDCSALDTPGLPPLEWVICLLDERDGPAPESNQPANSSGGGAPHEAPAGATNGKSGVAAKGKQLHDRSIDELAKFIDSGGSKKGKAKKKKKPQANGTSETVAEEEEPEIANDYTGGGAASLSAQLSEQLCEAVAGCASGTDAASAASSLLAAQLAAQLKPRISAALAGGRSSLGSAGLLGLGDPAAPGAGIADLLGLTDPAAPGAASSLRRATEANHPSMASSSLGLLGLGDPAALGAASSLPRAAEARQPSKASNAGHPGAQTRPSLPLGWSRALDLPPALVAAWRDVAGRDVSHVVEASGFAHFALGLSTHGSRLLVAPQHYVIAFPHFSGGHEGSGDVAARYHSALLSLRVVEDTEDGDSVEFELLSRLDEAPSRTPLRFTAGPVRINSQTGQRESMRLDLGECVRWAQPDYVEGRLDGRVERLRRQTWWVAVDTLRLLRSTNSLDCSGLDTPGGTPVDWVVCLVDDRAGPASTAEAGAPRPSQDAEACAAARPAKGGVGGGPPEPAASGAAAQPGAGKAPKPKKKKPKAGNGVAPGGDEAKPAPSGASEPADLGPAAAASSTAGGEAPARPPAAPQQAPPPSRTLALPSALVDSWCQFARKNVNHVAEATGFVHFELSYDADRGCLGVAPEHYIVAFPGKDKGRQKHHSALLSMRIVKEADIPPEYAAPSAGVDEPRAGAPEYVEFELVLRVNEAHVQQQLRITAGPVRTNPDTGQRESMRIDLGRCVRQIASEVVDDPRGKRVVQNRWWICVETLRLVCTANSLDCTTLDEPGLPPLEWVLCLIDDRPVGGGAGAAQPDGEAVHGPGDRDIDELMDFIDGKSGSGKKKKKKPKQREAVRDGGPDPVRMGAIPGGPVEPAAAAASPFGFSQTSDSELAAGTVPLLRYPLGGSGFDPAALAASSRPSLGGWETDSTLVQADWRAGLNSPAASRALDGLVQLETLLAGLRADFSEEGIM